MTTIETYERQSAIDNALMSIYWEVILHEPGRRTLLETLSEKLPHIPMATWPERLTWGGLFVNGHEVKGDLTLPSPFRLEYYEPRYNFQEPYSFFPKFDSKWVLYEDDDLLVMLKPQGLPSMPAREQKRYCLKVYADSYVGKPVHMPSRLDMSTAGVVVMSKNEKYHNTVQRLFERRRVKKSYLFETASAVSFERITVNKPIDRDPTHQVLRTTVTEGGKPAVTTFERIGEGMLKTESGEIPTVLIKAEPLTGRTHQIRVHALSIGVPVVGDKFYMGAPASSLHLLSYEVALPHPRSGGEIVVGLRPEMIPEWAHKVL